MFSLADTLRFAPRGHPVVGDLRPVVSSGRTEFDDSAYAAATFRRPVSYDASHFRRNRPRVAGNVRTRRTPASATGRWQR